MHGAQCCVRLVYVKSTHALSMASSPAPAFANRRRHSSASMVKGAAALRLLSSWRRRDSQRHPPNPAHCIGAPRPRPREEQKQKDETEQYLQPAAIDLREEAVGGAAHEIGDGDLARYDERGAARPEADQQQQAAR